MMNHAISKIDFWPDYDLFDYSLPIPLKTTLTEYSSR
jgi:hypothetical protein